LDSQLTVAPLAQPLGFVAQRSRTAVLVILPLVYVVNYLDRQVLAILLPQIKAEFHLSDSALGLLSGTSFAVVYATLGVPLAFLADRLNRKKIIAASLAMFSVMTVACGWVAQFWQLLLARVGTGVGEAGTSPAINSIIADLYPREERATALAFYSAGLNVGLLVRLNASARNSRRPRSLTWNCLNNEKSRFLNLSARRMYDPEFPYV